MILKPVGIYREMYRDKHGELPSIADTVTQQILPDHAEIIRYLNNAPAGFDVMESVKHLFEEDRWIPGGSSLNSDGVWVWRQDSIEYLAAQPLELPADFVNHVRANDYTPPAVDEGDTFYDALLHYF
ncbi:hypothetical protein R1T08_00750 [Streptomyces sp. SBC-4]|nr:hypothetical protein [Streptomyces sp. SBC-4]MDV5142891.1 hypothetical protein [Streptomyces sp. SBC-4]